MYSKECWEALFRKNSHELISHNDHFGIWLTLERYWNNGSPSGHTISRNWTYSPFSPTPSFSLPAVEVCPSDVTAIGPDVLNLQAGNIENGSFSFPCHPDIVSSVGASLNRPIADTDFSFSPTGSGRTVALFSSGQPCFQLKLHYSKELGRFKRDLSLHKWLSSLERSQLFQSAYFNREGDWSFYQERLGHFIDPNEQKGFGNIIRSLTPTDLDFESYRFIPGFSLFASPFSGDSTLFAALLRKYQWTIDEVIHKFLVALVDTYFFLALRHGIMPEINAQNIVFAISDDGGRVVPCIRDMQDVYIDLDKANVKDVFGYKMLFGDAPDLRKRRSFSFDFKLCEYFLIPFAEELVRNFTPAEVGFSDVLNELQRSTQEWLRDHQGYFLDTLMYSYSNHATEKPLELIPRGTSRLRTQDCG